MPREQPQRIAHDDTEPPARRSTTRESPREETESERKVWRSDGNDAEEGEADGGVEARPEVDELPRRRAFSREKRREVRSMHLR